MLPSRFDSLREQLLRAGIAPRHVHRYVAELRDHFDDLVREERANGAAPGAADAKARARLGNDDELAAVMLARPELRSLAVRYPWAVFGLSPIVLVLTALAVGLLLEGAAIYAVSKFFPHPTTAQREWFVFATEMWNALWTFAAPLAIAAGLCLLGLRQRMPPAWIFAGIVLACFFGAFQEIHFTDDGRHGELSLGSGLFPPFPAKLVVGGMQRLVFTLVLAAGLYWFGKSAQGAHAAPLPTE
jgi:hypothetical protein